MAWPISVKIRIGFLNSPGFTSVFSIFLRDRRASSGMCVAAPALMLIPDDGSVYAQDWSYRDERMVAGLAQFHARSRGGGP